MKTIRNLILSLILPLALVVPELARAAVTCPICGIPIETTSHRCSPGNVGGGGDQKARQRQAEIDTVGTMQREFRRIELDTQERIRRQNAEAEAEAARERALQNQRDDSPPRQRDDSPPRQREDFGSRGSDPGSRRSDPVNYTPDYDRGTERPVSRATAPKPVAARPLFSEPLSSFLPTDRGGKTGAAAPARSQTSDWRSASLDPQPQSSISSLLDQITPPQDSDADYDKLVALCRESLAEAGRFRTGREDLLANAKWAGGQFEQGKSDATLAQVGDAAQVTKGLTDVILVAAPEAKIFKVIAAAGSAGEAVSEAVAGNGWEATAKGASAAQKTAQVLDTAGKYTKSTDAAGGLLKGVKAVDKTVNGDQVGGAIATGQALSKTATEVAAEGINAYRNSEVISKQAAKAAGKALTGVFDVASGVKDTATGVKNWREMTDLKSNLDANQSQLQGWAAAKAEHFKQREDEAQARADGYCRRAEAILARRPTGGTPVPDQEASRQRVP